LGAEYLEKAPRRFSPADAAAQHRASVAWLKSVVASTRVVCNPRGYADEPNREFDPGLVITV